MALVFLQSNPLLRALAIFLAMITDGLDGYLARRFGSKSSFGTLLDPMTDKFFALFVLTIFFYEDRLSPWEVTAFLSRDIALLIFGLYLVIFGSLANQKFGAIWMGKLTTTLQFFLFLALTFQLIIPPFAFLTFIGLGILAFFELALTTQDAQGETQGAGQTDT